MLRVLFLFVIVTPPTFADTAAEAFERGLAAYQKHDFPAAREAFEAAAKLEPPTVRLLHDLALAHARMNEKARALGLWRKALALDPNFGPARAGREMLEVRQRMRPFEGEGVLLVIRHALERIPPFVISWALALAFTLAAWGGLRHWAEVKRAGDEDLERPRYPWGTTVAGLAALAFAFALGLRASLALEDRATIVSEKTEVRSLPNARAVALFEILGGVEVLVKRRQEGWAQVQNYDGATGWVPSADLLATSEI